MQAWFRGIGAVVTTIFVFVVLLVWLGIVSRYIGTGPTVNAQGAVILDKFDRAKDILLAILPLATTAVGYWLGTQGTSQAQDAAEDAKKRAKDAEDDAQLAKDQLLAVVDVAPTGVLLHARWNHPEAFGLPPRDLAPAGNPFENSPLFGARTSNDEPRPTQGPDGPAVNESDTAGDTPGAGSG